MHVQRNGEKYFRIYTSFYRMKNKDESQTSQTIKIYVLDWVQNKGRISCVHHSQIQFLNIFILREDPKPDPNRESINGESINGGDLSPDTVPVVDSPDTTVSQNWDFCRCGKCPVMKDQNEQVCCKIEKSWQEKYNSSGENINKIM